MHFDEGDADCRERVAQRHARVRVGGRVDDDEVHPLPVRLLDALHQLRLGVALIAR
jgi:hypothetical protein